MSLTENPIAEADLHAFVDGRLTVDRRADVLRLLASSRADRALIEAWQDQNDILRGAFAGVEREPLPAALNLSPSPHLRLAEAPIAPDPALVKPRWGGKVFVALATAAVVVAGVAGAWTLSDASATKDVVDGSARTSIDADLAARAIVDLADEDGASKTVRHGSGGRLPTTTIPDLSRAGFGLIRAEMAAMPASLVFHYENAAADRVVVVVAHAANRPSNPAAARIGDAWSWHRRDKAYAIAGTMPASRLHALAAALQGGDGLD